jgi:hypothetical protein
MIRRISDISTKRLLGEFLRHEELRMHAVRRLDVPAANRHQLKASALSEALAATPEGRAELEKLLSYPKLYVRVSAAGNVLGWAPRKAIPVLGRLLDADFETISSIDERLDIRVGAKDLLYKYFDIRSSDRNDLIEPLKKYGVELSYRDHAKWQ